MTYKTSSKISDKIKNFRLKKFKRIITFFQKKEKFYLKMFKDLENGMAAVYWPANGFISHGIDFLSSFLSSFGSVESSQKIFNPYYQPRVTLKWEPFTDTMGPYGRPVRAWNVFDITSYLNWKTFSTIRKRASPEVFIERKINMN